MDRKVELKIYKEKSILDITEKNALYCIKADNETTFRIFVTDKFGNVVYLKDETGTGGGGTITNIISTDATLEISGTTVKDIKIATNVLTTINSALQPGDNVSALINDSGYITLADIPAFNTSDYDLDDFTNTSADPFVRISDILPSSTNLSYTASPTQGSVNSDTGNDAIIPLANNTNAGLFSPEEKNKLDGIQVGAEVNVNADWNATSGDAQILNKPTIPDVSGYVPYTGATQDVNIGENKYISDKGFEIPSSAEGQFFVEPTGNYLSYLFQSDGTLNGSPLASIQANSEEGISLTVFDSILNNLSSIGVSPQQTTINTYDNGSTSTVRFFSDSTDFDSKIITPKTFYTPTAQTASVGEMVWNDTDGTVDLGLKGGNVTLQIGQESVIRVVNKTATNIDLLEANYQAVRVTGAQGNRLKVDLAQANSDLNSAETIGLVTETINNNQEGFVTTNGLVRNINTTGILQGETWLDGDMLYLSPTVAGRITKVKPTAPNHLVVIGYVVRAHATQGQIFVKVDNGYELDELHNVAITSPVNNQVLTYNSVSQVWENSNITELNDLQIRRGGYILFDDFHTSNTSGQSPFVRIAISGGSVSTIISQTNHPGINRIISTTVANSGGLIAMLNNVTPVTALLQSGMRFDTIIQLTNGNSSKTIRCGLIQGTITSADAQNGCYFEIIGTNLVGKTANASTRSSTSAYVLQLNTFYHLRVTYNSATLNTFEVFDMSGSLLFSGTLTTNINIGNTLIQPTLIATNSGTQTIQLVDVDYIGFTHPPYNRGALT